MLRVGRILYVSYAPCIAADELECRHALTLLVAFEADVVVVHGLAPRAGECLGIGCEQSGLAAFLLYHHMIQAVGFDQVDVGVDGSVAPVEQQPGFGEPGERLVGIRIIHAVVFLFGSVPHRVVYEVSALAAVGPHVCRIPECLWRPHTVDGGPVAVYVGRLGVAEYGSSLAEVECHRLPVYQVVARVQVYSVVVPLAALSHAHVRGHHQIARPVILAADIGIARAAFDACMFRGREDGVAVYQVVKVQTVAAQRICRPFSAIAHMAVQIAVVSFLQVLCRGVHRCRHGRD